MLSTVPTLGSNPLASSSWKLESSSTQTSGRCSKTGPGGGGGIRFGGGPSRSMVDGLDTASDGSPAAPSPSIPLPGGEGSSGAAASVLAAAIDSPPTISAAAPSRPAPSPSGRGLG